MHVELEIEELKVLKVPLSIKTLLHTCIVSVIVGIWI